MCEHVCSSILVIFVLFRSIFVGLRNGTKQKKVKKDRKHSETKDKCENAVMKGSLSQDDKALRSYTKSSRHFKQTSSD